MSGKELKGIDNGSEPFEQLCRSTSDDIICSARVSDARVVVWPRTSCPSHYRRGYTDPSRVAIVDLETR
ncbi:hypothetical protein N7452_000973 [Penicillium brevicompactum]|uniref:Uncharacterized protein n=1 Tax=Penicillium brevicompactum TaxID=5074 RepID=A0A9W9UPM7_PENBR|nr:hypothetical protein N7452_000973 [Penicillium brevicompactum]